MNTRDYLDVTAPHFHVCSGKRPGGAFLQKHAWQARETVMRSVTRTVDDVVASEWVDRFGGDEE
jgi:hypothetical protein